MSMAPWISGFDVFLYKEEFKHLLEKSLLGKLRDRPDSYIAASIRRRAFNPEFLPN
jgi:hypothetical protein